MTKFLKRAKPLLPVLAVVIAVIIASFYIPKDVIIKFVKNAGIFAPIVFILIDLTTFIFAPLSGTPVMAIGYYLFGNRVIIYGFIVVMIASITNFWISRIWGIGLVSKLIGKDNMEKLDNFSKEYGLATLFISKFFLRGFDDVISYAAGLTSMKFAPYMAISTLAAIPGTILLYFLSSITDNVTQFTILIVGFSYILLIVYLLLNKFHKNKNRAKKQNKII